MKKIFVLPFLVLLLISFAGNSNAQVKEITGYVTALDSIPVAKVQVKVLSSKVTVLTDSNGIFKINCLPNDKLKVSANGFFPQKVIITEATNRARVDLLFMNKEKNIDDALVYGHIREKDRIHAISVLKNGKKTNFSKFSNMYELIRSISPSISVRGGQILMGLPSSLNGSNAALIVVDGVEVGSSQLAFIEPMNVKNVDILKNSAAGIYGVRGANGVVVITTKGASQSR